MTSTSGLRSGSEPRTSTPESHLPLSYPASPNNLRTQATLTTLLMPFQLLERNSNGGSPTKRGANTVSQISIHVSTLYLTIRLWPEGFYSSAITSYKLKANKLIVLIISHWNLLQIMIPITASDLLLNFSCQRDWSDRIVIKVAQNSFQHFPRRIFWWVIITTLYQLMLQSWYQKTAQSLVNTLVLFSWHYRLP